MHILSIIDSVGRGGAETLLLNLARPLIEQGARLDVAVLAPPMDLGAELEAAGVGVHPLGAGSPRRLDRAVPALAKLMQRLRPDVAHAHLFYSVMTLGLVPRLVRPALRVVSLHCTDYEVSPVKTAVHRARRRAHRWVLGRRVDRLAAVSRSVADHYRDEFGFADIDVVYNALPVAHLRQLGGAQPDARREHGFDPADPLVVSVGRMTEQKGFSYLIDAAHKLRLRHPRLQVAIVGRGPERERLAEQVRSSNLKDVVHLIDALPQADLLPLVSAADVFAMPSLQEGFGIALAEAMSLGRPVVATSIGPFLEFVDDGETGRIVPSRDADGLADAISALLDRREHAMSMGRAAARAIEERFDAQRVADTWMSKYRRWSLDHG